MSAQPEAEANGCSPPAMAHSEDSSEESSLEEPPAASWSELSIIERVGLDGVEMSEKDLETAFSQIALAFRCDQYTLKQRLQAEEHARNLAEENVQLELSRGRETLEALKGLCLDSKRSKILQKLQLSLDILGGTVERISNTAEVLGAVHQEARVSRAVELMVAHVENLRRRQDRNAAELEEAKRTIQQQASDPRASPDPEESDGRKKSSLQNTGRRRVSISLISTQIQEKIKRDLSKRAAPCRSYSRDSFLDDSSPPFTCESGCSAATGDTTGDATGDASEDARPVDPDEAPPEAPAAEPPPPPPSPKPECLPPKQPAARKAHNKTSPLETLRQRHRNKSTLSKKKAEKEKKSLSVYRRLSANMCASWWRHRPPPRWLHRCRWALLCTYLLVLLCVGSLTYSLWNLQSEEPGP